MSFDSTPPPAPQGHAPQVAPAAPTPPAAPPQKKSILRRWWFWAIVAAVLIAVFVPKGGGSDTTDADTAPTDSASAPAAEEDEAPADDAAATPEEPAEEEPATTPIGTPASTGDLELTVTGVEPGVAQVGEEIGGTLLGERAQGQFVLVHLTAANTGDGPTSFTSFNAKLVDAEGREFGANDAAALYIEGNSLYEEINPGNTLQGVLVFDIPADAAPTALEYDGGFLAQPAVFALQ